MPDDPKPNEGEKTFTQTQLDEIVEKRLKKQKDDLEKVTSMLEEFKKNKDLTEQQRTQMAEQIEHLNRQIMSKEELAAKEKKELLDSMQSKLKETEENVNKWKTLYESSTVQRSIYDEVRDDAFDPQQLIDLLSPRTKLVEEVVEGKSTGRLLPIVRFPGRDKEGKPLEMELPVADAVKEMKKMTDKYGNLFKSGLTPGLGGSHAGGTGGDTITDESVADHDSYMANREKVKQL